MIRILQIDRGLRRQLRSRVAMAVLEADADSPDATFEQPAGCVRHLSGIGGAIEADDVLFGEQAVQQRASRVISIEVFFVALRNQEADSWAAQFGENVGSDRGGPANEVDVFEEFGRIGKAEFR